MRKLLLLSFLFTICSLPIALNAQNTWVREADYGGGGRDDASGFAVGNKGYILSGTDTGGYFTDMWAWNSDSNVWRQVASYPGGKRIGTNSVSLNGYGYVLGGEIPASCFLNKRRGAVCEGTFYNDVWRYNPDSNTWLKLDTFVGIARDFAVAVADPDDSSIYYGTGNNNDSAYLSDWWVYYIPGQKWTQLNSFRGGQRCNGVGFYANGNIYVGTGNDNDTANYASSDIWEYAPSTGNWTRMADVPGIPLRDASAFSLGNFGYVCLGVGDTTYISQGWRYAPASNIWQPIANYGGGIMGDGVAFAIGSYGYIGTGTYDGNDMAQFWQYTSDNALSIPALPNIDGFSIYPNPGNGQFTIESSVASDTWSVGVYNVLGEEVYSKALQPHPDSYRDPKGALNEINLSGQPSGVYFYRVYNSGELMGSGKLVIAR
jgi:N-acetylneuraminic acid mutarotase